MVEVQAAGQSGEKEKKDLVVKGLCAVTELKNIEERAQKGNIYP